MEMDFGLNLFCFDLKKLSQTRVTVLSPAGEWITDFVSKQNKNVEIERKSRS